MNNEIDVTVNRLLLDMNRVLDKELSKENRSIDLHVRERREEYRISPIGFISEAIFERLTGKTFLSIPKPDPSQPGLFDDIRS